MLVLRDAHGVEVDPKRPILRSRGLTLRVAGFPAGSTVVFEARQGESRSSARFIADHSGTVDFARQAPVNGTWSGVDAKGWLWSMSPPPPRPLREPVEVAVSFRPAPGVSGEAVATTLRFIEMGRGVTTTAVHTPEVIGTLAVPPGPGPFHAVLVLGGSEGGNDSSLRRAADLASEGYLALALAYFGVDPYEDSIERIPVERVLAGLELLRARADVAGPRIALVGDSRGGELALVAAAHVKDVAGVVGIVPSGVGWGAMRDPDKPAWTWKNEPLPFVPWSGHPPEQGVDASGRSFIRTRPLFEDSLAKAAPEAVDRATIAVENIDGPVLLIGGEDDQLWPSCKLSQLVLPRLRDGEVLCLEDAGHRISVPGGSTLRHDAERLEGAVRFLKGGTAPAAARAERATREAMLRLLDRAFDDQTRPPARP